MGVLVAGLRGPHGSNSETDIVGGKAGICSALGELTIRSSGYGPDVPVELTREQPPGVFVSAVGEGLTQVGSAGGRLPTDGVAVAATGTILARIARARVVSILAASVRMTECRWH